MILVVGATGLLGGEICRRLAAKGKPIRALVRGASDQAKVGALRDLGAELVQGDLRDRISLEAACQGVRTMISTASSMPGIPATVGSLSVAGCRWATRVMRRRRSARFR